MVLAPRQKYRQAKQDRKSTDKLIQLQAPYFFYKGGKSIQWRKDRLFNKWCWETWTATCEKKKKKKLEHCLTSYIKINSKWINDLNVRPEIIKLLGENTGNTLFDRNHSKIFFNWPLKVMKIKTKVNKLEENNKQD